MKKKRTRSPTARLTEVLNYAALPVLLILLWLYAVNAGGVSPLLLPAPQQVLENFVSQLKSGQLLSDVQASLMCVLKGYVVGAGLGLVLGVAMGFHSGIDKFFSLILDGIRQIPGLAWFPLIILWFGIGDLAKIVLVARGTFFPVLVNTIDGVRSTSSAYMDLVQLYQVRRADVITKIYIPSALPFVCVGMRLGAGMAWMSVVAAEMMGATSGLGFRITTSQQLMQSDIMLVDIIIIGVLGWFLDFLLRKLTRRADKWKRD